VSTVNNCYNYSGDIIPVGVAKAEPIIQEFMRIQAAFAKCNADDLERLLELLRDIFPSLEDGGAIFSKYWPVVTTATSYALDMVNYGTHIIPLGPGGDLQITFEQWPDVGTKFGTIIFINGGEGIVRWPINVLWQTRGQIPPIMKETGFDTIALWRDEQIQSFLGQDIILAARAGR
jgi:hypothetical protein